MGESHMAGSVNLETLANAYQRVMKILPDSIDSKTKRELVISSLVEASERGVQDEDILTDSAITAVTRHQQSTVGRFVRGLLSRLTRQLAIRDIPPSIGAEHQPSCFALEEEKGEGWKGSGAMGPAINEARPSL
jgi:hypothetical protein